MQSIAAFRFTSNFTSLFIVLLRGPFSIICKHLNYGWNLYCLSSDAVGEVWERSRQLFSLPRGQTARFGRGIRADCSCTLYSQEIRAGVATLNFASARLSVGVASFYLNTASPAGCRRQRFRFLREKDRRPP